MGIKIHGECGGCHHEKDLVVEARFCSEACKQRCHDRIQRSCGFGCGVLFTLAVMGIIAFVIWLSSLRVRVDPHEIRQIEAEEAKP